MDGVSSVEDKVRSFFWRLEEEEGADEVGAGISDAYYCTVR